MLRRAALIASLLLLPTFAPAQQPGAPAPADPAVRPRSTGRVPQPILDDFMAGFGGDKAALDRAVTASGKLVEQDPANAEALAWRSAGVSAQCGAAFQAGNFQDGMRLWREGTEGLNKSVEMEPGNPHIRFVRGKSMLESSMHDPTPASSGEAARTAIDDLELALSSFEDVQKQLPKQTREEFYAWLLQASEKVGDKERIEKYRTLAGDKAKPAEQRVEESAKSSTTGEALRAALAILDSDLAKTLKPDLTAGLRDPDKLDAALGTLDKILADKPGDAPATAWHGFVKALKAGPLVRQGKLEEGSKLWQQGSAEITKAAANDPAASEPLILRGLTTLEHARRQADESERTRLARVAASDLDRAQRLLADSGHPLAKDAGAELSLSLAHAYFILNDRPKLKASLEAAANSGADEKITARAKDFLAKMSK
jgi:hypothetical protein